jgi:hypothetical protein
MVIVITVVPSYVTHFLPTDESWSGHTIDLERYGVNREWRRVFDELFLNDIEPTLSTARLVFAAVASRGR